MERDLEEYLYHTILPQYDTFDKAHQRDHIHSVLRNSLEIAGNYDVNMDMVIIIAFFHDLGLSVDRKKHHLYSGEILMQDKMLKKYYKEEERLLMKEAVEDHRASNTYPPRSIYGKIIAEADRDLDVDTVITRCIQYGLKHYSEYSSKEQFERIYEHIKEKYGENGYLKLYLPYKKNEEGLKEIRYLVANKELLYEKYQTIINK